MTAPDSRDSVERVVAEMRAHVKRNGVFAAGGITEQWADRLQALARGPQQAGGEDVERLAQWLDAKYSRHREDEDQEAATMLRALQAEVARLKDLLNVAVEQSRLHDEEQQAALREAGRDAERLDWLDGFAASSYFTISEYFGRAGKDRYVEIQDEDDAVISEAPTLRESIDKAMAWWEIKLREDAALNGGQDDG